MTIYFADGTNIATAPTGGKVLSKPVLGALTSTVSTQGSNSWTDLAGMSVTISPASSSSRIHLVCHLAITGDTDTNSDTTYARLRLLRGSTQIDDGDASSNWWLSRHSLQRTDTYTFCVIDHPNTTSSTTYKVQRYNPSNNRSLIIGYTKLPNNGGELWATEYDN